MPESKRKAMPWLDEKPTLLTIDWDFFVPEKPEWDLAHKESAFFLHIAWQMRGHLIDDFKTIGTEQTFWADLLELINLEAKQLYVSDSHAWVWGPLLAGEYKRVILVDAHHDCWETPEGIDGIECASWLRAWLELDPEHEAVWLPSDWAFDNDLHLKAGEPMVHIADEAIAERVLVIPHLMELRGLTIDALHLCRSGCWTPPWLDEQFQQFAEAAPVELINLNEAEAWDPMVRRWTKEQISEARALNEQMQTLVTTMNSSEFQRIKQDLEKEKGSK